MELFFKSIDLIDCKMARSIINHNHAKSVEKPDWLVLIAQVIGFRSESMCEHYIHYLM